VETYCRLALSGQQSGLHPGLCVQAVGSGLGGQRLRARDESALEVADRRSSAYTTMCYTNRQPLPLSFTSGFMGIDSAECICRLCEKCCYVLPLMFLSSFCRVGFLPTETWFCRTCGLNQFKPEKNLEAGIVPIWIVWKLLECHILWLSRYTILWWIFTIL